MSDSKRKLDEILKSLGALVVIGVLFLAFAPESIWHGGGVAPASERKAFGDFASQDLNGATWNLSHQQGRVVVVNYWATWCPPCRAETPALVRVANEYKARGLEIVGISLDEDGKEAVRDFVREYGVPYPILMSRERINMTLIPRTIPVTILIDRQGRIAKRYEGAVSESTLKQDVEKLLAEE